MSLVRHFGNDKSAHRRCLVMALFSPTRREPSGSHSRRGTNDAYTARTLSRELQSLSPLAFQARMRNQ